MLNRDGRKQVSLPSRGAWIEIFLSAVWSVSLASLPSRGAWIEMPRALQLHLRTTQSLPSRGAWIEIGTPGALGGWSRSRSPHGERGLKFDTSEQLRPVRLSLPSRGAWIEISSSLPSLSVSWSLPSRGAWIEIQRPGRAVQGGAVAPLTGSVD